MNIVPSFLHRRTPLAAMLALSIATGGTGAAVAQDGTGAATPTPSSACEIVPATWTGEQDGTSTPEAPAATPMATPSGDTLDIPVIFLDGIEPAADEDESGTDAVNPLEQDIQAVSNAIAGCLSDARYETLVQITGEEYRGQLVGFGLPLTASEFMGLAEGLPEVGYQILSIENVTATSDTTATAEVTYELAHQVRFATWTFEVRQIDGQDVWTLRDEELMTPVAQGTNTLTVEIADGEYQISDATVEGPSVSIEASNSDERDHEVLVLRLSGDAETDDLLGHTEPGLPEGISYVGQATVPAGSEGTLLLSGLQPGTYTIVDLLPNEQGLPNLANGMETTFEVE